MRRVQTIAAVAVLLMTALVQIASMQTAAAATVYVVTTESDVVDGGDGQLSLREAVDASNSDGDASTIQLTAEAEYDLTLCGPAASQDDNNLTGDLDHTADEALTISSPGPF